MVPPWSIELAAARTISWLVWTILSFNIPVMQPILAKRMLSQSPSMTG